MPTGSEMSVYRGRPEVVSRQSQRRDRPKAETERHCLYEECFNGDGAVVSYLNNVRSTKETTMKLCHEAVDVADRGWTRKFVQEPPDHKDVAAPDDLRVGLGFTQLRSGGGKGGGGGR